MAVLYRKNRVNAIIIHIIRESPIQNKGCYVLSFLDFLQYRFMHRNYQPTSHLLKLVDTIFIIFNCAYVTMDNSDRDKDKKTSHCLIAENEHSNPALSALDTVMRIATKAVALNESDDDVDNARAKELLHDAIELLDSVKKMIDSGKSCDVLSDVLKATTSCVKNATQVFEMKSRYMETIRELGIVREAIVSNQDNGYSDDINGPILTDEERI